MSRNNIGPAFGGSLLRKPAVMVSLGCLLLFTQPAQAQEPLNFFKNYFVTGDYVVHGASLWRKGVNGVAKADILVSGVPEDSVDIVAAFLYVQTAENVQWSGIDRAKFRGHDLGPGDESFAKALNWELETRTCWSFFSKGTRRIVTYRADVLRFLPIKANGKHGVNGLHRIQVPDSGHHDNNDGDEKDPESPAEKGPRALGASLVIVYRDPRQPLKSIVIYDGGFTKPVFGTMTQKIEGFYQASSTAPAAKMSHIVGDGNQLLSERVLFNDILIATNPYVGGDGRKWDNPTFNDLPLPGDADQAKVTVAPRSVPDCLTFSAMIFSTTVQDTDSDGLLDRWETDGGLIDPNGQALPNLSAMGASPYHKDLFVEIGFMYAAVETTYGDPTLLNNKPKPVHTHLPTFEALTMVGDAFKNAPVSNPDAVNGIRVHFDVGDNYQVGPGDPPDPDKLILPADLARGGEAIDEMITICPRDEADPRICQFSGDPDPNTGYPGTVGWKTGFRFLRDGLLNGDGPCETPGNDGPGEICERRFDRNRKDMFHYLFSAHSVGIPKEPCLNADDSADFECQKNKPDFHVPRTYSGIADFPGGDLLLTLGWFDDAEGKPVGTPYMQGATIMHEWGHNFDLKHGGPANPVVNGAVVPQIPREPNCKSNYLSVMNYLFQLRGLPDKLGVLHMDYSGQRLGELNENILYEGAGLGLDLDSGAEPLYRTGWYAPKEFSFLKNVGKAATKHCDGSEITQAEKDAGVEMVRVDATSLAGPIDWKANGDTLDIVSQDINFNGGTTPLTVLNAGSNDWANIRLNELGGRRNVGGLYRDLLGRLAVGPMSLNVGNGDIGNGDIGNGDIGNGDIGNGDIGNGDIGNGDIGNGDIGRGDLGRGFFGGGDLDVGGQNEPVSELDLGTAKAVEGADEDDPASSPPTGLVACLTSDGECVTEGGNTPVRLGWEPPHFGTVGGYLIYRFEYTSEPFTPAPGDVAAAILLETVSSTSRTYLDSSAPPGAHLAYFIKAQFDGTESGISNFATVTTPPATIFIQDLGTSAPPDTLGGQTMTPFGDDTRDNFIDVTTVPSPLGGNLTFDSEVSHRTIGEAGGWLTWSHGYGGDVYFDKYPDNTHLTMTLPAGTTAFYFYAEPNNFDIFTFTVTTTNGDTVVVTSGDVPIDGNGGAVGFGFYASNTTIASITVTSSDPEGFAVGEFGIAKVSEP